MPLITSTMFRTILLAVGLSSISFTSAQLDQTVFLPSSVISTPETGPYDTYVNHFSASRPGTDTVLQSRLSKLYSNTSLVVTQDNHFNLLSYASSHASDHILVKPLDDLEGIKRTVFHPPLRRRDGDGVVAETTVLAGYEVAWGEHEFKAIVATWRESFYDITQWHLIGAHPEAAQTLIHAVSSYNAKIRDAILVFEQSNWRTDHGLWQAVQKASWDDVILDDPLKKAVQHDYRSFFKAEDTYKNLGVPWKRGVILLGPPGNGKTISIKAIMRDVGVPALYVKSFHTYAGDEYGIREVFKRARAEAPCVLILEDLDSLITDLNRSFFLNEVDGLEDNDGLLLIGTTNHLDRLDPALSSRPSRFDRKYDFPNPSLAERHQYAVYWQNKLASNKAIQFPDSLLDEFAQETDRFSFAFMNEAFISALLTLATDENPKKPEFRVVLLEQVKHLREQLETGKDPALGMAGSWGASPGVESSPEWRSRVEHPAGRSRGQGVAQSSPMSRGAQTCVTLPGNLF